MVVLLLLGGACAGGTARATECAGERARARAVAARIREEWPLRGEDDVTRLVRSVMERLASAHRPRLWRIAVVRNRNAEAYAIGDGRIYVSDGAVRMCESESELAAVLAHEMGHQILGHFCNPVEPARASWWERGGARRPDPLVGSVSQRIDPAKELGADRYALMMIERVGYEPHASLRIARRVQRESPRGHLDEMGRVERLERLLTEWPTQTGYQSESFAQVRGGLIAERRGSR